MDLRHGTEDISSADDVYSIIRSPEIREYYCREDPFGIFEKEQLILHSYTSIQQKAALLAHLAKTGTEKERRKISEMCRVFCNYMERIYHPAVRTVFLLESSRLIWDGEKGSIDTMKYGLEGACDTVDELIADMADMYSGCEEEYFADVTVLEVSQGKKVVTPFGFSVFWIDGKWEVKDLHLGFGHEELRAQGFHKDTADRFHYDSRHHPLPFENGCRLKLQLPFMKEPFYGTLESELDGLGCWYHSLRFKDDRSCGTGYVDLTPWEIDLTTGYSSLDWIGRV